VEHVLDGGGAHWLHLANTIELSMCGGDAAVCQITLTTCFFAKRQFITVSGLAQRQRCWTHQLTYSTWNQVSSGMGGGFSVGQITSVCNQPPRPTQPPTISGTGTEYRPKCGDTLRLGSKGRFGSMYLWIKRAGGR